MSMLFVDFDNTLFDKERFKNDLFSLFLKYGVSKEMLFETYAEFSGKEFYTPQKHLDTVLQKTPSFSLDQKQRILSSIDMLIHGDLSRYLFPDTEKIFSVFSKSSLAILSYGDKRFQMQKIFHSGLGSKVSRVIVTYKEKALAVPHTFSKDEKFMVLIDDFPEHFPEWKKRFSHALVVHVNREHKACFKNCDFEIDNLEDLFQISKIMENTSRAQ